MIFFGINFLLFKGSLQSISDFHSVLKKQYQEAYSGGCLKSGYNEEWQYSGWDFFCLFFCLFFV